MLNKVIVVAGALAIGSQAVADQTQLARSIGVEPGAYSTAQLDRIRQVLSDGSNVDGGEMRVRRILANAPTVADSAASGAGRMALARQAGISPEGASVDQLHQLVRAQEDREDVVVHRILTEISAPAVSRDVNADRAGKVQLARSLRLDPTAYSLAELVRIKTEVEIDVEDE